jgi:hypothetical protein
MKKTKKDKILKKNISFNNAWHQDKTFVSELNERVKRWEDGTDAGFTIDEIRSSVNELRKKPLQ